jgi:galactokinase
MCVVSCGEETGMAKFVNVEEDLKHPLTQEEIEKRVAHARRVAEEFNRANKESPLPDDIMDAVYGRTTSTGDRAIA